MEWNGMEWKASISTQEVLKLKAYGLMYKIKERSNNNVIISKIKNY